MRLLIFTLILLTIPAFAQDDELPRRLTEEERRESVKCPPNMRRCVDSSATPIPEADKENIQADWRKQVKAHGNKPVVVPKPREEGKSRWDGRPDAVDISVIAGLVVLLIFWVSREVQARR